MPAFLASAGRSTMVEAPVSTIMETGFPLTSTFAVKWPSRRFLMRTSVSPPELCSTVTALPGSNSPTTRAAIGISSSL